MSLADIALAISIVGLCLSCWVLGYAMGKRSP